MKLEWKDYYTMNLPEIDNDHKQLFRIAQRIVEMVDETGNADDRTRFFVVREGVKYLKTYFAEHAVREEAYMRSIGYEHYLDHKRLHDEFQIVEIGRFEKVISRGSCTREEVLDFVGAGVGWLVEHIATADMAIVGKGVLCRPRATELTGSVLEQEINTLFAATLNLDIGAKVINGNYGGEAFGEAIYHRTVYLRGEERISMVSGIEKSFLRQAAQRIYGGEIEEEDDVLILSTLELFGASFWRTLGERLLRNKKGAVYAESRFLSRKQVQEMYEKRLPAVSLLFDSRDGKFFVASGDRSWLEYQG